MARFISSIYSSKAIHPSKRPKRKKAQRPRTFTSKEAFASEMRDSPTLLERILAARLRAALKGTPYRPEFQFVHSGYILDAYIPELRLAFEADGPMHNKSADDQRDGHLLKASIRTVRFSHRELHGPAEPIVSIIKTSIEARRSISERRTL